MEEITSRKGLECSYAFENSGSRKYEHFFGYIKVIKGLQELNQDPNCDFLRSNVIKAFTEIGILEGIDHAEGGFLNKLYLYFEELKTSESEKIGIVPLHVGNDGGSFFFIMFKHRSRETMVSLKSFMECGGYSDVYYPYQSRNIAKSSEGVTVEQDVSDGLFSEYISRTSVFLEKNGEKYIGQHDISIVQESENVVLDSIHKKIFYKGDKLTYKNLRSQSSTVEILMRLINQSKKLVHNSQLPPSSYSKNKNEMIGKIIYPLKMFMSSIGFDIDIECEGSLYDFYISLKNGEQYFTVLTSVFP